MSYVHCHKCDWQQDDFWGMSYNPVRFFFMSDVRNYIWPRMVEFDPKPYSYGRVFSWRMIWVSAVKWVRRIQRQHWWTYEAWQRDRKRGKGGCPKCGAGLCCD